MLRINPILIGFLTIFSLQASVSSNDLRAVVVAEFTTAYQMWNGTQFIAAADLFTYAITNTHMNTHKFYWLGVYQFHGILQLKNMTADPTNESASKAVIQTLMRAEAI